MAFSSSFGFITLLIRVLLCYCRGPGFDSCSNLKVFSVIYFVFAQTAYVTTKMAYNFVTEVLLFVKLQVSKHDLIGRVLCYTLVHPKELKLGTEKEAFDLCTESLNLWSVCIRYGLACEHFRYVYLYSGKIILFVFLICELDLAH